MPQHHVEVSPVSQGVILPKGATPIRSVTERPSLAPRSSTGIPLGVPYESLTREVIPGEIPAGVIQIAEQKAQFSVLTVSIVVPGREADSRGRRGVELGKETFYSLAEIADREASAHGSNEREELYQSATQTGQIF